MRTPTIRKILLGALLLLVQGGLFAQQFHTQILRAGDTNEVQLCRVNDAVIFASPQFTYGYHATFDAWGSVQAINTMHVMVQSPGGAHITISDASGIRYNSSASQSGTTLYACSSPLMIYVHVDSGVIVNGSPSIRVVLDHDDCQSSNNIWGIVTSEMGGDSVDLTFHTSDSLVLVSLDDDPWIAVPSDPTGMMFSSVILHDVICNVDHTIKLTTVADSGNHCCWFSHDFQPTICPPAWGCFEATDLQAEHVTCSYGSLNDNIVNHNIVNSRHTVMRDTTQYDATLGDTWLHTVCTGCDSTIRLGNNSVGAQWEAIDYKVTVDTLIGAILILKYAAVLENPNHSADAQPRFSFDLLDENMSPVGNACVHADFIASNSMGWAQYSNIMWKDWTSVGFDLSDYHGQTLNLCLKTSDCTLGGHFGYAYFTTQCATRKITVLECGVVDSNTFLPPEGFNYQWLDTTGTVISTDRTIRVPSNGNIYHCRVISIEDTACNFLLSTYSGTRLPKAAGSVEHILPVGCRRYDVSFKSTSYITSDGITPVPYGGACDEIIWHFGDGDSATGVNPTHTYTSTGTHNVTIVATLGGGQCTDTAHLTVTLDPVQLQAEETLVACDSLRWRDSVLYATDTLGATCLVINPAYCDTLYTLNLHINHSSYGNLQFDTVCLRQVYQWNGNLIVVPADSTQLTLCDTLRSVDGCDSSVTLHLATWPDAVSAPEHDTVCYGQSYTWRTLTANDTSQPQTLLCLALRDTLMSALGCDSIVGLDLCRWPRVDFSVDAIAHCGNRTYTVSVNYLDDSLRLIMQNDTTAIQLGSTDTLRLTVDNTTAYLFTAGYTDSLFCMADTTLILRPFAIPEAALKLTPEKLTYENLTLHAYDITGGEHSRSWSIVHADGDSVRLPDHEAHLVYNADVGDDSTRVVLAVDNGVCLDTATGCIYLVRADFFAPNVFTPGLADNNRFVIPGIGIRPLSLSIFNRMGLLVFSTDHPEEGWDGTHEGVPCMQGAYVWHLTYTLDITPERIQTAVGTVTLVR